MEIEIKKLTPGLLEDYLYFFENTAHKDIKDHDVRCYCMSWCSDDQKEEDFPSAEIRRNYAVRYVKNGMLQGYLAYYDNRIIGWCNANNRADCTKCHSWRYSLSSVNTTESDPDIKVKSIFCFIIAPDMRRNGIAVQLLEYVCKDAANDGFDYIEAYPNKNFVSVHDDFMGPADLYKKCGFSIYGETEHKIVIRKYLK
ncbi:GNAT family N-acetyltransferase [Sebaldella sp. S0638]|uniref:GNAT family N-acetyltransferase n=1 Tax=Sebaldella sp. S0638 TaxID=2957809 RepID=UPI00209F5392|nr:GNAT family N-acetyltransferase [Sebaldella sp. S0638]